MKRYIIQKVLLPAIAIVLATGCKKFDEINSNPDKSNTATAEWLAANMITSITSSDIGSQKSFAQPFLLGKYILWSEGKESFQYNNFGRASFGRISLLRNIPVMEGYATTEQLKNSYSALGHFIRAWQFFQVTMQVGDIPYSEAVKGESDGNIKPKYDSQKDVFKGILDELDQANGLFATGADISGDFIYGGKVDKWRRLANSFELHVLMNLYKKTADADLKVVDRFKDIVANRPLMASYDDNFAVKYINSAGYVYPWSNTPIQTNPNVIYSMVSNTIIDLLKASSDRRLFYYAEPATAKIAAGLTASDFNAYVGTEPANTTANNKAEKAAGNFSDFNARYAAMYNAEPVGLFNYWDLQFILAEATVRGWITTATAQSYYAAGISSSMSFLAKYAPANYVHGMPLTDAYIAAYSATVALTGTTENQVKQIITQKYMAGFFQGVDYNAWYENRRTGYPTFTLDPATNANTPSTKFPVRWLYPSSELDYNGDNVAAAITSQYDGNDNVNGVMWLLK